MPVPSRPSVRGAIQTPTLGVGVGVDVAGGVGDVVGVGLGVGVAVAKASFQHGGDAGTAGRQSRRLRIECKKYADTTPLNSSSNEC